MGEISDLEFRVKMCLSLFGCEVNILAKQHIVQCRPSPSLSSVFLPCNKLKKSFSKTLWTISQRKLNLEKQKVQRLEVHVDL